MPSGKRNKTATPDSSPVGSIVTLDLIYKKMEANHEELSDKLSSMSADVIELKEKLNEKEIQISSLVNELAKFKKENDDIRRRLWLLENTGNRTKLTFIDASGQIKEKINFEQKLKKAIDDVADVAPTEVRIFQTKKGMGANVFFSSSLAADETRRKWKIFKENYNFYVNKFISVEMRKEMQSKIQSAKSENPEAKVKVVWSLPAAFVGEDCVWPDTPYRRPNVSYALAASKKNPFDGVDVNTLKKLSPSMNLITQTAPPEKGSEFIGFMAPWDGEKSMKANVDELIKEKLVPFEIDAKRDNIIYAAVAVKSGKIIIANDDGGERNSSTEILKIMAEKRVSDAAIIIVRKYGGVHMFSRRYAIFRQIAGQLLDRSKNYLTNDGF